MLIGHLRRLLRQRRLRPRNTQAACGTHGGVCVACSGQETCVSGTCQAGQSSCATTCSGCCAPTELASTPPTRRRAAVRAAALARYVNDSSNARRARVDDSRNGCIDSTGTCQQGTTNAACGTGGLACQSCNWRCAMHEQPLHHPRLQWVRGQHGHLSGRHHQRGLRYAASPPDVHGDGAMHQQPMRVVVHRVRGS